MTAVCSYRCVTTSCMNSFSSLHQFNPYLIYFVQLSVKVLRCRCLRSGFELCIKFTAERERCTHVVVLDHPLMRRRRRIGSEHTGITQTIKSLDCLCYLLNLTYREVILDTQEHWHWLLKTAVQYTVILHKSWNSMLFRNLFSVSYSICLFLTLANFELYTDWLLWLLRRSVLSSG